MNYFFRLMMFLRILSEDGARSFAKFPTILLSGSDLSSVVMAFVLTGIPLLLCFRPDQLSVFLPLCWEPASHVFAGCVMSGATRLQGGRIIYLHLRAVFLSAGILFCLGEDVKTTGQQSE